MSAHTNRFKELCGALDALAADKPALETELKKQLAALRFPTMDLATAWRIGEIIREVGLELGLPIAARITLGRQVAFHTSLPGASADNDRWADMKANVAAQFLESSLAIGNTWDLVHGDGGFDRVSRLPLPEYGPYGGAIPLLLESGIGIGTAAVSGLPAVHDHALVATALEAVLAEG